MMKILKKIIKFFKEFEEIHFDNGKVKFKIDKKGSIKVDLESLNEYYKKEYME